MAKKHPFAKRLARARKLVQKAREIPPPAGSAWLDFSYAAQVKDFMRQANDQIKLIQHSPSKTPELEEELAAIYREMEETERALLGK